MLPSKNKTTTAANIMWNDSIEREELFQTIKNHLHQDEKIAIICRSTICRRATYRGKREMKIDSSEKAPLTEATYFIMLSLAQEPRHGYAIMKDVHALSDSRVVLSTGTLYGALKRLLEQGWIKRVEADHNLEDSGRVRKAYTLTRMGQRILEMEISRLRLLIDAAGLRTSGAKA
jgi:DNA-binding PadR family transcriptional regulator